MMWPVLVVMQVMTGAPPRTGRPTSRRQRLRQAEPREALVADERGDRGELRPVEREDVDHPAGVVAALLVPEVAADRGLAVGARGTVAPAQACRAVDEEGGDRTGAPVPAGLGRA